MTRNRHLSKSILDSGWGIFRQFLTYKAVSAGREVIAVKPAYNVQMLLELRHAVSRLRPFDPLD